MRSTLLIVLVACKSSSPPLPSQTGSGTPAVGSAADAAIPRTTTPPSKVGGRAMWEPIHGTFLADKIRVVQSTGCAVSRDGKLACWGQVEYDDDSVAVERRQGMSTPHVLVGIDGVIDVVHEWFYLCVAQKPEAGDGGCFLTNAIDRKPPVFPSPPVVLGARPMSESGVCAVMRDGKAGCVSLEGKYTEAPNIREAVGLACASDGCCAVTKAGAVQCWGDRAPKIPKLPPVSAVTWLHDGGCARTTTGGAQCWGDDELQALTTASGVRDVGYYDGRICLVRDDGTLRCENDEHRPVVAKNVVQVDYSCVRYSDGSVGCSGDNSHGELGDGGVQLSAVPVQVPGVTNVVDLNVAHTNACALTKDKALWCWGPTPPTQVDPTLEGTLFTGQYMAGCHTSSYSIECRVPTYRDEWDSEYIAKPKGMKAVETAAIHRDSSLCVVSDTGAVQCRHGMSEGGVVDSWIPLPSPAPVVQLEPVAVGFCARHADGRASCFVDHRYDADDDFLDKLPTGKLVLNPHIKDATTIATGQGTACMLNKASEVWCWDADDPKRKPWQLPTLTGASSIGANHLHTCVVKSGEVWCWGENFLGELGIGAGSGRITPVNEPVKVKASFKAVQVGTGRDSSCALDDEGKVWCWGSNSSGQLGQPRMHRSDAFSKVVGIGPR